MLNLKVLGYRAVHEAGRCGDPDLRVQEFAGTVMPPWGGTLTDDEISTMVEFLNTVEP